MKSLPGINIQFPISTVIIGGDKSVETRTYPLPMPYVGKPMVLVETPGKMGKFPARAVGIITFGPSFKYKDANEFAADFERHCVGPDSKWSWQPGGKWGWPITALKVFATPIALSQKRGIVFTKSLLLPAKLKFK